MRVVPAVSMDEGYDRQPREKGDVPEVVCDICERRTVYGEETADRLHAKLSALVGKAVPGRAWRSVWWQR